jgi:NAD(P)-dependent dehydrogenase (short-subunit alcohol dehydrogenase family)
MATTQQAHFYASTAASVSANIRRKGIKMGFDFSGKRVLLAGLVDEKMIAAGKALHEAGAALIVEDSPLWGDLPHEIINLNTPDPDDLHTQIEALGTLDILIFQPGWRLQAAFLDHSPADWDTALATNFEIPIYIAQAAARLMIAGGRGGRILFLSAVEGIMPFEGTAATGTSLTMLEAMAKMMAVDLAPHGITVNVLASGWVQGERYDHLPSNTQQHIHNGIPIGQPAQADDISAAVTFLASDAAAYITGAVIPVDGGYTLTRSDGKTMLEA